MVVRRFGALFIALAIVGAACGSDDAASGSGSSNPFFDPSMADRISVDALPVAADLPGDGWAVLRLDDFTAGAFDFSVPAAAAPVCDELRRLDGISSALGARGPDDLPAGRASVDFERNEGADAVVTSVALEINIEDSTAAAQSGWSVARNLFDGDGRTCMASVIAASFEIEESVQATARERTPSAQPPSSVALAYDIDLSVDGGPVTTVAFEMYLFPVGNATVDAVFSGPADRFDATLVSATLDTIQANLARLAETA